MRERNSGMTEIMKDLTDSDKVVKSAARNIIISILVFIVGLYMIAVFMNRKSQYPSISLETKTAEYTIERADGSTETYDKNRFPAVENGDTLICEFAPLGDVSGIQNGTLVFTLYHSYVSVYCGDELIYRQTEPEKGKMIGHRYYIIPLPKGYENETIRIEAVCAENDTYTSLKNPRVIPGDRATYAFRTGQFATGILLITLLIVSIFIELSGIITWIMEKRLNGLISISFLGSCISLWYMGFSGYMQPFVESTAFLGCAEYASLYLCPVALALFAMVHTTSKKLRRFCQAEAILLAAFFVFATVVTLFVPGLSYVDYVAILRILFLMSLIVFLIAEFRERKAARDLSHKFLHRGMTLGFLLGIIELGRFLLADRLSAVFPLIKHSIMPLCILVLVLTAFIYYGIQLTANQYHRLEEENLKKLAFVDPLTGAPNRAACDRILDSIEKSSTADYVVTFIDINFLKKTNDTWGHDKGDELIRTASDLLRRHFHGNDFFGRWGGDEFIAVHFGTLAETKDIMNRLQQEMDEMNETGNFDFTLSVAWGYGESTKEAPLTPPEAVKLADEHMYTAKQKAHAARS